MGLDITCHRNLVVTGGREAFDDDGNINFVDGWFLLRIHPEFDRADGLCAYRPYKAEESMWFTAGSYSSYGIWLSQLAELAKPTDSEIAQLQLFDDLILGAPVGAMNAENGPFVELISFSDCEGVIGPETSAKLAKDFADYQAQADQHSDEYFRARYRQWREAFEFARVNGAVCFH